METSFSTVVDRLVSLLNYTVPILIGIALFMIVWGLAISVMKSDSEEEVKKGKSVALRGALGLFIIIAVWGLVYIIVNSFFSSSDIEGNKDISDPVLIDIKLGE